MIDYQATSKAAYNTASVGENQRQVLAHIESCGLFGSTCDEFQVASGMSHQSASPAFHHLARHGLIYTNGGLRMTRSGRQARVWLIARKGKSVPPPPTIRSLLLLAISQSKAARESNDWQAFDNTLALLAQKGINP